MGIPITNTFASGSGSGEESGWAGGSWIDQWFGSPHNASSSAPREQGELTGTPSSAPREQEELASTRIPGGVGERSSPSLPSTFDRTVVPGTSSQPAGHIVEGSAAILPESPSAGNNSPKGVGGPGGGESSSAPHAFPFMEDHALGGDSVASIRSRLLFLRDLFEADSFTYQMVAFEAEDLFEIKAQIIGRMAQLDPEGAWEQRGARALASSRTRTGELSLEVLYKLMDDLEQGGVASEAFLMLKEKRSFYPI